MYALHVYEGGSATARLIISSSLAALKAVRVPRLELLGALIGLRLTRHVCSPLKCLHKERPLGWTIWTWGTRSKDKVNNKSPS